MTQILQGVYPHPLIYKSESLRQKTIDIFGFKKFQENLAKHLKSHFSL